MKKIEIPTDTPSEFELEDTAADIQRRREGKEQSEGGSQVFGNSTHTHRGGSS